MKTFPRLPALSAILAAWLLILTLTACRATPADGTQTEAPVETSAETSVETSNEAFTETSAETDTETDTGTDTETSAETDTESETLHVHEWGDPRTIQDAVCDIPGIRELTCSCGEHRRERTPALGHTEIADAAVPPTCTESGLTEGSHCAVCSEILRPRRVVDALGHAEVIDPAVPPTGYQTGLSEGAHCARCFVILIPQDILPAVAPTQKTFPGATVTTAPVVLESEHLRLHIPANVFLPDGLTEELDRITSIMEAVSGLSFDGDPRYAADLTKVTVVKDSTTESELGVAYATVDGAVISSGDVLRLYALVHECSHLLQLRQSPHHYCLWAMEGISTYTTYKTQLYVQEHYPDLTESVGTANESLVTYAVRDYEKLYEYPITYWMENDFAYAESGLYSIGFRFMHYLDVVYGDYTRWILVGEEMYPSDAVGAASQLTTDEQIAVFRHAYGEGVFEGFYGWLRENEDAFSDRESLDLRGAESFNLYPVFAYGSSWYTMHALAFGYDSVAYADLFVGLESGVQYLTEYKGKNADGLCLRVNPGVTLRFYDSTGHLLRLVTVADGDPPLPLDGVSFLELVGEGELTRFLIQGYQ